MGESTGAREGGGGARSSEKTAAISSDAPSSAARRSGSGDVARCPSRRSITRTRRAHALVPRGASWRKRRLCRGVSGARTRSPPSAPPSLMVAAAIIVGSPDIGALSAAQAENTGGGARRRPRALRAAAAAARSTRARARVASEVSAAAAAATRASRWRRVRVARRRYVHTRCGSAPASVVVCGLASALARRQADEPRCDRRWSTLGFRRRDVRARGGLVKRATFIHRESNASARRYDAERRRGRQRRHRRALPMTIRSGTVTGVRRRNGVELFFCLCRRRETRRPPPS